MAVSFKEFAFTNMLSLANSLCFVLFTFVIPLLCALFARFPWILNKRSLINGDGVDEVGENTDDRNQFDSAFESFCEQENSLDSQSVSNATTSKYEFLSGNSFSGYIENPQITSFKVQELFLDSAVEDGAIEESVCRDSQEFDDRTKTEDSEDHHHPQEVEVEEKIEGLSCTDPSIDQEVQDQELVCSEQPNNKEFGESDDEAKIEIPVTDEPSMDKDLAEVKVKIEDFRQVDESRKEGSDCNEPSLDEEFPEKDEGEIKSSITNSGHDEEELESRIVNLAHDEVMEEDLQDCVGARSEEVMEEKELISLDPNELPDQAQSPREKNQLSHVSRNASDMTNDFWHTNGKFIADFDEYYSNQGDSEEDLAPESPLCLDPFPEDISGSDTTESDIDDNDDDDHEDFDMEEPSKRVLDEDDEMDIDVLLEHQSYVRKLKKEMRNLRTIGLPTILEDSESPRMDEDLRPLKISEKVGHKDRLEEIQRFYRTYLDKMKRLDVLCHQTMYAIGMNSHLKNPDQVAANKKLSSLPSIKSLLPHNILPNRFRRDESDPVHKLVRDLHRDLELVYVGQLCLSWEILKWQHTKSEELQLFDTMGLQHYSLAAGEFQQFHVLVQRFTEDEPFQLHGPRVENYVKTRSANSSFLQVPLIKDDAKTIEGKAMVVSIVRLTDIIEESMHAFWRLVRADKKEPGNVELRDPLDAQLLSDIRANLAKKERRIKDLVKSGNCIVRKFQKHQDLQLTHELLVAQVELKLVGRVIGMTRVTSDQLMWCHKKLGKINILGKKVYIESSFSLFPC
ncbi:hypothetical protein V2J09_012992 [Rumex salicifolius]